MRARLLSILRPPSVRPAERRMASAALVLRLAALLLLLASSASASGAPEATECELTTGRALTVIKSAGFPARYAANVDCRYTVRRRSRSVCSVTFLFNVMDLEASPNCTKDYLALRGERMCGSKPIGFSRTVSFSEDDQVTMSFHSDNETRGLGYMVTVVQQDCPPAEGGEGCDADFSAADFQLASPGFPLPYGNGRACRFRVRKADPRVCRLLMRVRAFDLEPDPHCQSDFLLVGGDRLCGLMSEGQILDVSFPNSTLTMEFHSDHMTTRDGFKLDVHQEVCDPASETPEFTPSENLKTSTVETLVDANISTSTISSD